MLVKFIDQIGFGGNIRERSFPNTGRNLYSSSEPEQHGVKFLLELIKTQKGSFNGDAIVNKWHKTNPFRESWHEPSFNESIEENVFFPNHRKRQTNLDTPINPLKNKGLFDIYKGLEESDKENTQEREEQKTIAVQTTKESAPSKEWSFKPTIFTLKLDIRNYMLKTTG